jgi:hypothetical protein
LELGLVPYDEHGNVGTGEIFLEAEKQVGSLVAQAQFTQFYQIDSCDKFEGARIGDVIDEAAHVAMDFGRHERVGHVLNVDVLRNGTELFLIEATRVTMITHLQHEVLLLSVDLHRVDSSMRKVVHSNGRYVLCRIFNSPSLDRRSGQQRLTCLERPRNAWQKVVFPESRGPIT